MQHVREGILIGARSRGKEAMMRVEKLRDLSVVLKADRRLPVEVF